MRLKIMPVALLLAALTGPAAAQQITNLRVAPHPVPYPFFDDSQMKEHTTLSLQYVGSTMKINNAPDLSLNGMDLGVGYRRALNDQMAWDAHFSIIPEFGSTDFGTKMYTVGVPLSTNFEYQAYKTPTFNVIGFAGPNFGIASSNYARPTNYGAAPASFVPNGEGVNTSGSTTLFYGFQFGVQAGIETGWVKLAPYVMVSPDWGHYTQKQFSVAQNNIVSTSGDLPATLLTSFGGQIWLGDGFAFNLAYQTSPSYSANGTTYASYSNLIAGLNFSF